MSDRQSSPWQRVTILFMGRPVLTLNSRNKTHFITPFPPRTWKIHHSCPILTTRTDFFFKRATMEKDWSTGRWAYVRALKNEVLNYPGFYTWILHIGKVLQAILLLTLISYYRIFEERLPTFYVNGTQKLSWPKIK